MEVAGGIDYDEKTIDDRWKTAGAVIRRLWSVLYRPFSNKQEFCDDQS